MNIIKRAFIRIRKAFYKRKYREFHYSSGIGSDGCGGECIIQGSDNISVGPDSVIGRQSEIMLTKNHFSQTLSPCLLIGKHVRITARCRITCANKIVIEDDVLIAPDVFITDHNHGLNPEAVDGYSSQKLIVRETVIRKGVWIGQKACVLAGVEIGEHSVIGAGSIVTHDIPSFCIAVGNPARVIKQWDSQTKHWKNVEQDE